MTWRFLEKKKQFSQINLEEAKKLQNVFKSNLNATSRLRNKSEKQKMTVENIKLLFESREAVI